MGENRKKAESLVAQMTLEEKAGLCSGSDMWHTKSVERLGIRSIMVSDGPHGLRKQEDSQDNLGIGDSVPATCFPTASLLACSFDPSLAGKVGSVIADEAKAQQVSVLLGPGINIKRSPLCGRNFEYFSEDPIVAGKMGAGYIKGVQSKGVGTSLKHFAVNNQERRRMSISATVDKRTLHEIYLKGFEIAVKEANPRTVMCSYNKINGVYSSENKELLTNILREKWGYDGLVVSDWGAVHDRPMGVDAGLDLEMPGSMGVNDRKIIKAVNEGKLSEEALDKAAANVVELILDSWGQIDRNASFDKDDNHTMAVRAAEESMVLLKNEDGLLPLGKEKVGIIGAFAEKPRFQGAGSSKVNAIRVDTPIKALEKLGVFYEYAGGFELDGKKDLTLEALEVAKNCEKVVIFAGLPERCESEGFDRADMKMPEDQNRLIEEISKVNPNVIVVLIGGAPIEIPWADSVKAILLAYLGGEGMGSAVANILTGKVNPSGKLAETWPLTHVDAPCAANFPGDRSSVLYKESVYIGYRYYETFNKPVRYRFGHGLSYTDYEYSTDPSERECTFGDEITVSFKVKNTGKRRGKETSFVWVKHENKTVYLPAISLVAFTKTDIDSGEEKEVELKIDTGDFGYYHTGIDDFYAEPGEYRLYVGGSIEDLVPLEIIKLKSEVIPQPDIIADDFTRLMDGNVPTPAAMPKRPFSVDNCLEDVRGTLIGRIIIAIVGKIIGDPDKKEDGQGDMMRAMVMEMPFFALQASSAGMLKENQLYGMIDMLNGHIIKGIGKFLQKENQ
ncbi:MAG: beta-glucosidase [Lachnospiraceae bacterium]|jgi:beta-glucosidase|nr:beta-glucosidase [Lachnospiraceae bacterium]